MWLAHASLYILTSTHFFISTGDAAVIGSSNFHSDIDESDFKKLVERGSPVVDKSRFLKEILNYGFQTTMVCRPRRFGKSTNLSMLKHFLTIGDNTTNIFENFSISRDKEFCEKFHNKYPVIHISFKEASSALTFQECMKKISGVIRNAYLEHSYLESSGCLRKWDQDFFRNTSYGYKNSNDDETWQFRRLMRFLHEHHKKWVVVLLDDYDSPLLNAHFRGFYNELVHFLVKFMTSTFKSNPDLQTGVIFGASRISTSNLYSGMNNAFIVRVVDDVFSESFGFTNREVEELLELYKLNEINSPNAVQSFYGGYKMGGTVVYNPSSLISYLNSGGVLKEYWPLSGAYDELHTLLTKYGLLTLVKAEVLINGGHIDQIFPRTVEYFDINNDEDAYWTLLTELGYLTIKNFSESEYGEVYCDLMIPNNEIKEAYRKVLKTHVGDFVSSKKLIECVMHNNGTEFLNILTSYLSHSQQYLLGHDPVSVAGKLLKQVFQIRYGLTIEEVRICEAYITRMTDSRKASEIVIVVRPIKNKTQDLNEPSGRDFIKELVKKSLKSNVKDGVKYVVVSVFKLTPYHFTIF